MAKLRFITRNYKHELRLSGPDNPRSVLHYTDKLWNDLCREIARRKFNGIVFYTGYHPFQFLLDYAGFPEAAVGPAGMRADIRRAFNRGLAIARAHGLQTFIEHYITHFTPALAKNARIPVDITEKNEARLAGYDLPIITDYCRYCYREIFKQCPDLSGLYFNFESSGNACKHIAETAVREANKMSRKPIFVYRLWAVTDVDGIAGLVRAYEGKSILAHKIADGGDTYHLPVADCRILGWKKAVPGVEFMFQLGPCHNCATNLDAQVWADYDYVQAFLADAERKGCDSISFQSSQELLTADLRDAALFGPIARDYSLYNILHLEAAADYFQNRTMAPVERHAYMARRLGVKLSAGRAAYLAILKSSQAVPLAHQQFHVMSGLQGFWMPDRTSLIQDPYLFYPATELGSADLRPYRTLGKWTPKAADTAAGVCAMQYIIDYVNPAVKSVARNPAKMAATIRNDCESSLTWIDKFRKLAGNRKGKQLFHYIDINYAVGMWIFWQIRAAIEFYSIYFAASKKAVVRHLQKGLACLHAMRRLELKRKEYTQRIQRVFFYYTLPDISPEIAGVKRALDLVRRHEFPMPAYAEFLASRREYNSIRRFIRPTHHQYQAGHLRRAEAQIARAMAPAKRALTLLDDRRCRQCRKAVAAWLNFLEQEKTGLQTSALDCGPLKSAGQVPFQRLTHEQCFRWGEHYFDDFTGFFTPGNYYEDTDQLRFKVGYTRDALVVILREDKIDINQRLAHWRKFEGSTYDAPGFARVFIAPKLDRGPLATFMVLPRGTEMLMQLPGESKQTLGAGGLTFKHDASSWELVIRIPFRRIGAVPAPGNTWGFNLNCNTAILRNRQNSWRRIYETPMSYLTLGRIKFT